MTQDNTNRAIFYTILVTLIFGIQDAISKYLAQSYPIYFFVMIRFWVFGVFAVFLASYKMGGFKKAIRSKKPLLQALRGVILVSEIIIIVNSLKYLAIAQVHAIFMGYPLLITGISALFLGEAVGWRRWSAVVVGFAGVLLVIRPGLDGFNISSILALIAAILFAAYSILTKIVSRHDKTMTSLMYMGIFGGLTMTIIGLPYWSSMAYIDMMWLGVLSVTGMIAHYLLIKALEMAPATILQPFNYLSIVWAIIIGLIIFKEVPDIFTLLGSCIVIASGLYIIWRERYQAQKKPISRR